jgi:vancomycin resistance protein VanW
MPTSNVRAKARALAAPSVRRVRREVQWRRSGARRGLDRGPVDVAPHQVARHATPLFRALAGVDPQLQRKKVVNLGLAIERLDGLLLRPGQRFSFWRQVGKPTRRRGFLDGLVLDHGRATEGVGGGMCQLTNLIYWMRLHTPLTVVERWRHSYDVFPDAGRTQPFGSGATCAWPVLDLQIENTTSATFRLGLHLTGTELSGAWAAEVPILTRYEVYESHHLMTNDAPGVFTRHNVLRRRVLDASNLQVGDELVAMNQGRLMYQPFLEAGR